MWLAQPALIQRRPAIVYATDGCASARAGSTLEDVMLGSLDGGKLLVLLLLVLFVFGPERLPELTQSAAAALRQVRRYVNGVTADLKGELGPELGGLDLQALRDPKTFIMRQLWGRRARVHCPAATRWRGTARPRGPALGPRHHLSQLGPTERRAGVRVCRCALF